MLQACCRAVSSNVDELTINKGTITSNFKKYFKKIIVECVHAI